MFGIDNATVYYVLPMDEIGVHCVPCKPPAIISPHTNNFSTQSRKLKEFPAINHNRLSLSCSEDTINKLESLVAGLLGMCNYQPPHEQRFNPVKKVKRISCH